MPPPPRFNRLIILWRLALAGLFGGLGLFGVLVAGCSSLPPPTALPIQSTAPGPTTEVGTDVPEEPLASVTLTPSAPAATQTPSPTDTPTATPTPFPITLDPTVTPTPEPTLREAEIQISIPGPLSRVTSPMLIRALLAPGANGRIRVELLGEDGRLLVRQLLVFNNLPNRKVSLSTEIDFEIAAVAETGRLSLSVDDRFGRLKSLASVDLILLASGESDINPPGDLRAPLIIEEPAPEALIEGGEVLVSGLVRPTGAQPLVLELITADGKVIGSRQAAVAEEPAGEHRPFAALVPYQVSEVTRVLLVIRERGERIPGTVQLFSQEILLSP